MPLFLFRHLSVTFYWATDQPGVSEMATCHHTCIQVQTDRMEIPCTFLSQSFDAAFYVSIPKDSLLVDGEILGFLPSLWVGATEVEEDDCAPWPERDPWLKLQESPFEHCPFAFHWKQSPTFLSARAFLPLWLWPTLPYWFFRVYVSLSSDQFVVLPFSLIFGISMQSDLDSIQDCTSQTLFEFSKHCNLFLYKPSRTFSGSISLVPKKIWSHLVSKSWTSSFCILNKSDRPWADSQALVARKYS